MTLTPEKFKQYFKLHKLAQAATVEAYMAEHPQEEYHYEDIDAVYQRQVEINVSRRTAGSSKRYHNARAGGGTCTLSGTKYGHHYQ